MSSVKYNVSGLSGMIDDMTGLAEAPLKTIAALETELTTTFEATQAATHIITHSLKTSGKTSSDFDGNNWEASIEYGGASPGSVNDPVDYAIYERARGGDHDFMAPTYGAEERMEAIIEGHFPGGKK